MFEDDTEYKLRFRANGTIEVEQRTEDGTQLVELDAYTHDLWDD